MWGVYSLLWYTVYIYIYIYIYIIRIIPPWSCLRAGKFVEHEGDSNRNSSRWSWNGL